MEPEVPACDVCGLVPLAPRLQGTTQLIVRSLAMQEMLKRAARFAASDAPVAVLGETGTGKEVVARIVHNNSERASQPFVAVNVAALPADLLESELFGHGKGAFTGAATTHHGLFEAAHKGTLFLDEIGEMPLPLQAKLLRGLQDGELRRVGENQTFSVDVRIISATHRDLAQRVRAGQFREDLYYRLKVLSLTVPPLRQRIDDILPLAMHFLLTEKTQAAGFSKAAQLQLVEYPWPGNVRELHNMVQHGAALARGAVVELDDLPDELGAWASATASQAGGELSRASSVSHAPRALQTPLASHAALISPASLPSHASLAHVEQTHILHVLDACGGDQTQAARVLGVARNTLWRKVRQWRQIP